MTEATRIDKPSASTRACRWPGKASRSDSRRAKAILTLAEAGAIKPEGDAGA
jgi:hypothetical protein